MTLAEVLTLAERKGVRLLTEWLIRDRDGNWQGQLTEDCADVPCGNVTMWFIHPIVAEAAIMLSVVRWLAERGVAVTYRGGAWWENDTAVRGWQILSAPTFDSAVLEAARRTLEGMNDVA